MRQLEALRRSVALAEANAGPHAGLKPPFDIKTMRRLMAATQQHRSDTEVGWALGFVQAGLALSGTADLEQAKQINLSLADGYDTAPNSTTNDPADLMLSTLRRTAAMAARRPHDPHSQDPTSLGHVVSMADRALGTAPGFSADKAARWLGWAQALLIAHDVLTPSEVKILNLDQRIVQRRPNILCVNDTVVLLGHRCESSRDCHGSFRRYIEGISPAQHAEVLTCRGSQLWDLVTVVPISNAKRTDDTTLIDAIC